MRWPLFSSSASPRPKRGSVAPTALETREDLLAAERNLDDPRYPKQLALAELSIAELAHRAALLREYGHLCKTSRTGHYAQ